MPLTVGTHLGSYEILALIGAGGMGEVYRARDEKLGRDVALKILPAAFTGDADRVARFQREAHVLASLNHAHIGAIYGLERVDAMQFLVLELVDGESLDRRVARGPIPVDESIGIAKQLAEALEAAHDKGIVHRDLKPANIALTTDGRVKVLDFGLARTTDAVSGARDLANSPTITSPGMMTGAGMILGTAAYMSPEQAKGRPADKRSDVWAFGCVLYEMLAGRRPFTGDDVTEIMAAVVRGDPDWAALPKETPAPIRALLERCLEKDRARRASDIAVAKFLLDPPRGLVDATLRGVPAGSHTRRRASWLAVGVLSAAAGAFVAAVALRLSTPDVPPPPVMRMSMAMAPGTGTGRTGSERDVAISPDGTHVAYVGANGAVFLRSIAQLDASLVPGLNGARAPFFSPDGQWIGFTDGRLLKKVAIGGGAPITVCSLAGNGRGAAWLDDGTIVFATNAPATGLWRVPASGGTPTVLTTPDHASEGNHLWPHAIRGRHAVLFTVTSASRPLENSQTALLDLETGRRTVLLQGGSDAHYLSTGHLLYIGSSVGLSSTLRVIPFDLARRATAGQPVDVATVVAAGPLAGNFDVSRNGTLVYSPGGTANRTLTWLDRQGREESINAPSRAYIYPRLSPDATRLALDIRDEQSDIWIWEFARGTLTRLTTDPAPDRFPVWTADGHDIVFTSDRAAAANIYRQSADGTTPAERLTNSPNTQAAMSATPDGRALILRESTPTYDLMLLPLSGPRQITPLVATPFIEQNGEVSPNGRWLAYEANDSGAFEIYVRPFPNVNAGRWQVSSDGGTQPLWSRDGRELFFLTSSGAVMASRVPLGADWAATPPTKLIERGPNAVVAGAIGGAARSYDVAPDGRFVFIKASGQSAASFGLVVVANWFEELKARAR